MRKPFERDIKKEILDKCFDYLTEKGLEQSSVKNLCEETGISSGSIYYWFKDRDEMISDCAKYGLGKVLAKMFDYALLNSDDLMFLLNKFSDEVMKYSKELRFVYQVVMSEKYGQDMRELAHTLRKNYDIYGMKLSEKMNIPYEILRPYVYMFISSILNYVVWEDYELMQTEFECICRSVEKLGINK